MQLPFRLAIGTVQPNVDPQPASWALINHLQRLGLQVQAFQSQAQFGCREGAEPITGQRYRHLDSWVMQPSVCHEIFCHGSQHCDIAVVEGRYDSARGKKRLGGSLNQLCDLLDLPRIAVVDVSQVRGCDLPRPVQRLDGVVLVGATSLQELPEWQTKLEALWGAPVIGVLRHSPALENLLQNSARQADSVRSLGKILSEHWLPLRCEAEWLGLSRRVTLATAPETLFSRNVETPPLRVGVAFDEAFCCYSSDTLDLLEWRGADVQTFSPLHAESLPSQCDVLMIGCGHLERYAPQLAANHCLKQSIRKFASEGGRIYAEGSGSAYLGRYMVPRQGGAIPMLGILPLLSTFRGSNNIPAPVELELTRGSWLAAAAWKLRGYRIADWDFSAVGPLISYSPLPGFGLPDLVGQQNVIASQLHLNFAAQADCLRSFFRPLRADSLNLVG